MATDLEYALMAGDAYVSNRSDINKFPVPLGWTSKKHTTEPSGFEAISFIKGSEIVISFAGTDPSSLRDLGADFNLANGFVSNQLLQAAAYYMEVRALYGNDVTITFTGHSLGGGLAALMAVFFDVKAVTFDQAPFLKSATEAMSYKIQNYLLNLKDQNGQPLYTVERLRTLAPELLSFTDSALADRSSEVSGYYVQGEFLTTWPKFKNYSKIASEVLLDHGTTNAGGLDLHSQALLTAFLINKDFEEVTKSQTDLLGMLFDEKLYARSTDKNSKDENFLERLVRHQEGSVADNVTGVKAITADDMLTRFTNDLQEIAQEGGLSLTNKNVADALTAFAMQMYYDDKNPNSTNKDMELFDDEGITGGLHFDRSDVAASLADVKGYELYFQNYLSKLPDNETGIVTRALPGLLDWHIQAGASPMTASASNQAAFMLGWTGADNLTGGTANDLLYGGGGADVLTGGSGNDTLIGGTGNDLLKGGGGDDTYIINAGDGFDTIEDKEGNNTIIFCGKPINSFYYNGTAYISFDGEKTAVMSGTDLIVTDRATGTSVKINEDFQSGDFGINLITVPDNPITTNTIYGDTIPDEPDDNIEGTAASDLMIGGAGNDAFNYISWGMEYGGNDWLKGGAGDDFIQAWMGENCIAEGNAGSDYITGGYGSNKLFGDDYGEMSDLIAAGETAESINQRGDLIRGGAGDDYIYGSNSNDALFGSSGKDLLVGGGGDDAIFGDDYFSIAGSGQGPYFWDGWSFVIENNGVTFSNVGYQENTTGDDDVIYAGTGNDYVDAGAGDDEVYGGSGNDTIYGFAGNDFVEAGGGDDEVYGGNLIPFRKKLKYKNTWRRFAKEENIRRAAA